MLQNREYNQAEDDEDVLPDNITETEDEDEEEVERDPDLEEEEEDGPPDTL